MRMTNAMQAALYWARKHSRMGPILSPPFVVGGTGWTVTNADATHIATFGAGSMRVQGDTVTAFAITKAGALVVGKTYDITATCSAYVSGSLKISNLPGTVFGGPVGTYHTRVVAIGTDINIIMNTANVDLTLASLEIRQVSA